MPWVERGSLQPFEASSYIRPFALLVLPNVLVVSALFFSAGALRRGFMAILLLGVGLVALWGTGVSLARDGSVWGTLVDPFGNAALEWTTREWTTAERTTRAIDAGQWLARESRTLAPRRDRSHSRGCAMPFASRSSFPPDTRATAARQPRVRPGVAGAATPRRRAQGAAPRLAGAARRGAMDLSLDAARARLRHARAPRCGQRAGQCLARGRGHSHRGRRTRRRAAALPRLSHSGGHHLRRRTGLARTRRSHRRDARRAAGANCHARGRQGDRRAARGARPGPSAARRRPGRRLWARRRRHVGRTGRRLDRRAGLPRARPAHPALPPRARRGAAQGRRARPADQRMGTGRRARPLGRLCRRGSATPRYPPYTWNASTGFGGAGPALALWTAYWSAIAIAFAILAALVWRRGPSSSRLPVFSSSST